MISDPILTPKSHRERLTQLAFEGLDVPGLYIQDGGVLSVMATGKQSGCAVDIGYVALRGVRICNDGALDRGDRGE